jgi:hypothetical protein
MSLRSVDVRMNWVPEPLVCILRLRLHFKLSGLRVGVQPGLLTVS